MMFDHHRCRNQPASLWASICLGGQSSPYTFPMGRANSATADKFRSRIVCRQQTGSTL